MQGSGNHLQDRLDAEEDEQRATAKRRKQQDREPEED